MTPGGAALADGGWTPVDAVDMRDMALETAGGSERREVDRPPAR